MEAGNYATGELSHFASIEMGYVDSFIYLQSRRGRVSEYEHRGCGRCILDWFHMEVLKK